MPKVGVALRPYAWKGASRDVGTKRAFKGWRRHAGIKFDIGWSVHTRNVGLTIHRENHSAGPWRVAEQGRNKGNAVPNLFKGPAVNRKKGLTTPNALLSRKAGYPVYTARKFKPRRWNGYTEGKNTWSYAAELMADQTPRLLHAGERAAIAKAFLGK
jgi:hypothetical protein